METKICLLSDGFMYPNITKLVGFLLGSKTNQRYCQVNKNLVNNLPLCRTTDSK